MKSNDDVIERVYQHFNRELGPIIDSLLDEHYDELESIGKCESFICNYFIDVICARLVTVNLEKIQLGDNYSFLENIKNHGPNLTSIFEKRFPMIYESLVRSYSRFTDGVQVQVETIKPNIDDFLKGKV